MKSVLIISYYFPPSGGPGVQRVLKFVRYLSHFKIRPVVLTVENGDFPVRDESLMSEIPSTLPLYRTRIIEPYAAYRAFTGKPPGAPMDVNNIPKPGEKRTLSQWIGEAVRSNVFIPDARMLWWLPAVEEGMRIIRREHIDAIYSSSPPYTTALIARTLKNTSRLPWVAGFRDPWRGFLSTPERVGIAAWIDKKMEESVYRDCDAMEVAWKGIAKDFQKKYPDIDPAKVIHIENGFDDADIPDTRPESTSRFTITYTGSMYGRRSPEKFLASLQRLIGQGQIDPGKICVRFIGRFGDDIIPLFKSPILERCVEVVGYRPHKESVQALLSSDALLLIVDETEGSEEIVPGKVYEYIGTSRPIITLAPEGAIAELIRKTNSGRVASPQNEREIDDLLMDYYLRYLNGETLWSGKEDIIATYTRKASAKRLAELLNTVIESKEKKKTHKGIN